MKKTYLTRKNLIFIALAIFYFFILLFIGECLDGAHTIFSKKNPIQLFANFLNFRSIEPGVSGFILLVLVGFYIPVIVTAVIYEARYAVVNKIKPLSFKMVMTYLLTLILCIALSFGVGILIQRPLTQDNIKNLFSYIGQVFAIATLSYFALFLLASGILMFIINFVRVDKPFKTASANDLPNFDDEDLNKKDVTSNFDEQPSINTTNSNTFNTNALSSTDGIAAGTTSRLAESLDDREKVFPALSMMDKTYDGYAIDKIASDEISLSALCDQFRAYLAKKEGLYFDIDTIRFFISGFSASHFLILEGLSGTGKSSLPRYFAKFVGGQLLFLSVQATWRDKSNLIGYFNDFSKTYTETELLTNLYHANYNPDMIHIFVLDEMNISRVEYYFADFLSVLEYPEDEWKMKIMQLPYDFIPPAKLDDGFITIPNNVYFVGTANKDDSTFTITDKVYDRAITIDFEERNKKFNIDEDVSEITLSKSQFAKMLEDAKSNETLAMNENDNRKLNEVADFIHETFDLTFGNRILKQIEEIIPVFVACGGTKEDAIDFLLSRKVISKLEGHFEEYIKDALKELLNLLEKVYGKGVLKRSEKVINSIIRRL